MLVVVLLGCAHAPPASLRSAPAAVQRVDPSEWSTLRSLAAPALLSLSDGVAVDTLGVATWPRTAGGWRWPVDGTLTSPFGPRWGRLHGGIDVGAPIGTPVTAPRGGVVIAAGSYGELGLMVELDHGEGWTSRYGHLSAIEVAVGDALAVDEALGQVGTTGNATGPHLHWEIRQDGIPIDPSCAVAAPWLVSRCATGGGS